MAPQTSFKKKAIGGILWSFGDKLANQGIQFIIQIILARLLLPEHFGLVGLILVFIVLAASITESGFAQALIREPTVTQKDYSTVFYFNIAASLIIYLILYLAAPMISVFFEEPELTIVLRVVSAGVVINSLGIIPKTILTREVNFKTQAKVNFAASAVSGILAIGAALSGFGIWSLIVRTLVMNLLQSGLILLAARWTPSFVFSVSSFKKFFSFGWKILLSGLLNTMYQNIYLLVIGKQFSTVQLGYYANASKFSEMISQTLTSTIQRVAYPLLSSIQSEEERLKQTYRKIIKLAGFVLFPVMIGTAAIGEPLIAILFGEKWMPMVIYFQLLCVAGMLYPIHSINLSILQVKGRSDLFLILEIMKIAIASVLIALSLVFELGIIGLVAVVVLNSYIAFFINTHYSGKEISYSVKEQLKDLAPVYMLALTMGAVVLGSGQIMTYPDYVELALQVGIGGMFYIVSASVLKFEELKTVYKLLLPVFRKIRLAKSNE